MTPEYLEKYAIQICLVILILALTILVWLCWVYPAEMPNIDINAIIQIESSGNPMAISKDYCRGLMQISNDVVKEFCKFNGFTQHSLTWLSDDSIPYQYHSVYDVDLNIKIGTWYLTQRIPQMLRHYKLEHSVENILIAYNFGIGNLIKYRQGRVGLPKETRQYIERYQKLAKGR